MRSGDASRILQWAGLACVAYTSPCALGSSPMNDSHRAASGYVELAEALGCRISHAAVVRQAAMQKCSFKIPRAQACSLDKLKDIGTYGRDHVSTYFLQRCGLRDTPYPQQRALNNFERSLWPNCCDSATNLSLFQVLHAYCTSTLGLNPACQCCSTIQGVL